MKKENKLKWWKIGEKERRKRKNSNQTMEKEIRTQKEQGNNKEMKKTKQGWENTINGKKKNKRNIDKEQENKK